MGWPAFVLVFTAACLLERNPDFGAGSTGDDMSLGSTSTTEGSSDATSSSGEGTTSTGSSGTSAGTGEESGADTQSMEVEICDGIDNDGDGLIDEFSPVNVSCGACLLAEREGRAYWLCFQGVEWATARLRCLDVGADLVVIDEPLENEWLLSQLEGGELWLGASDAEVEGEWTWVDGTPLPLDHPNWADGQPDDHFGEDCLRLIAAEDSIFGARGEWNDQDCLTLLGYICESP